jgi:molybdopterin-guanine dinucleotide biosynthesis protein A
MVSIEIFLKNSSRMEKKTKKSFLNVVGKMLKKHVSRNVALCINNKVVYMFKKSKVKSFFSG